MALLTDKKVDIGIKLPYFSKESITYQDKSYNVKAIPTYGDDSVYNQLLLEGIWYGADILLEFTKERALFIEDNTVVSALPINMDNSIFSFELDEAPYKILKLQFAIRMYLINNFDLI